jgi:hypothetical protein
MILSGNQHRALDLWWSTIFSENPVSTRRVKPEGMLFQITP